MAHEQRDTLETKAENKTSGTKRLPQEGHRQRYNDKLPALEDPGLMKVPGRGVWPLGGPSCGEK